MELEYGIHRYCTTPPVESRQRGTATIHLHRETDHPPFPKFSGVVAEVEYCDATERYYLQTFDPSGVPTEIILPLIAEAEMLIPYK